MDHSSFEKLEVIKSDSAPLIGEEDYVHTSVMIPLVFQKGEYHLLFERRNGAISQGYEVCFPGGKIDPASGETSLDAAIRETAEEIGIDRERIMPVHHLGILITNRNMTVDCHVCRLNIADAGECIPNPAEVESVFMIPVTFFEQTDPEKYEVEITIHPAVKDANGNDQVLLPSRELGLPSRYHSTWGNFRHPVYSYKTDHGVIWGITARIILTLVKRIRSAEISL